MEYYYVIFGGGIKQFDTFDFAFKNLIVNYLKYFDKCYLLVTDLKIKTDQKISYGNLFDIISNNISENKYIILCFKNFDLICNDNNYSTLPENVKKIMNYAKYLEELSIKDFNELYYQETSNNFKDKADYLLNIRSSNSWGEVRMFYKQRKYRLIKKKFNLFFKDEI